MIISASRRTDIPSFYSDWFIKRLEEGYVLVPNPYNLNQCVEVGQYNNCIHGYKYY